jgi:hypothetical protein
VGSDSHTNSEDTDEAMRRRVVNIAEINKAPPQHEEFANPLRWPSF